MTPQERELIDGLFQRLKGADTPQKDGEAADLIAKHTVEQPGAPYLLVQTVLVQDHALGAAQQRIAQLEKELADAHKAQAQAPAAAGGGTSFLGGLLAGGHWNQGGTGAAAAGAPHSSVPITAPSGPGAGPAQAAPPSYAAAGAAPYAAAPASGGFLHSALTTAAGVAAGGLLYNGLSSLLFHRPGPFGPYLGTGWGGGFGGFGGGFGGSPWGGGGGNVYETVNNYGTGAQPDQNAIDTSANDPSGANDPNGNDPGYDPNASDPGNDPNVQDVNDDPSDNGTYDDGSSNFDDNSGGDLGGGDFGGGSDDMSV